MSEDLIAFLNARLDEDAQIARVAAGANPGSPARSWVAEKVDYKGQIGWQKVWAIVPERVEGGAQALFLNDILPKRVTHVARHDPARVLREVEAKRKMLEAHGQGHECQHFTASGEKSVVDGKPWVYYEAAHTEFTGGICDVLRLLGLPYADHPDYREEWRP